MAAYRVLGKLGGNNRKMIVEPQKLAYNKSQSSVFYLTKNSNKDDDNERLLPPIDDADGDDHDVPVTLHKL